MNKEKPERIIKCPLCKLPFADGQRGNFIDGQFYHQKCMNLYEKLTNSEGQMGEKSLLSRFDAAAKAAVKEPEEKPAAEVKPPAAA